VTDNAEDTSFLIESLDFFMSLKLNDLLPFSSCRYMQNWQKARKKQIGSANLQQNLKVLTGKTSVGLEPTQELSAGRR
jgi:hypothetical protein